MTSLFSSPISQITKGCQHLPSVSACGCRCVCVRAHVSCFIVMNQIYQPTSERFNRSSFLFGNYNTQAHVAPASIKVPSNKHNSSRTTHIHRRKLWEDVAKDREDYYKNFCLFVVRFIKTCPFSP